MQDDELTDEEISFFFIFLLVFILGVLVVIFD
jgi:hypothetical protein